MDTQKQEELGKLYALRAGLSIISQKYDEITAKEKEVGRLGEKLQAHQREINNYDVDCGFRKADDAVIECLKDRKRHLILSFATLPLVFLYMPFIYFFLFLCDCVSLKKLRRNRLVADHERQRSQETVKYMRQEHAQQARTLNGKQTDFNDELMIVNDDCNGIRDMMSQECSNVLDIRDWENLDLVIYYYETGRADSIKEALQLVDNERRNNALIQAIGMATSEICQNIQALGGVIIRGFESLSAQLEAQRVQMADSMSEIVTQQKLGNALLAKANVSSKEMVEQMKALNHKVKSA